MKKKFAALFSVIALFALIVTPATASATVFKFAGQSPPNHPATTYMKNMAKEIKAATKGRVDLRVYPANQLGNYTLVMEELIRGTIDFACLSVATDFDPHLEILYINGYLNSYGQAKKAFTPGAWMPKQLDKYLSKVHVKLLGSYVEGFIGIASTKPLKQPLNPKVDKGVLARVPNMLSYQTGAKAMGFRPITIPYSDVYQSMQTGVCDAADGYSTIAAYTILGDVMKYWYHTMYSMEYLGMMVSEKSWKKISPADQKIIQDVMKKYTLKSIDDAKKNDDKAMANMKKKGIKVFTYTPAQLKPIHDACVKSWAQLGKKGLGEALMKDFTKQYK
jgi:TRAP-type C4-dicarboxylate transport system substrate-binding protein